MRHVLQGTQQCLGNIGQNTVSCWEETADGKGRRLCLSPSRETQGFYRCCMFACETQILQRLAVLVVCNGIAGGHIIPNYFLVERPMPWVKAREFCQRHYVDLAVLSSEEQYFTLLNATLANKVSFWLGLQRQSVISGWKWVSGEELGYEHWYRRNYEGCCASLEAVLKKEQKLLARYCNEPHMIVCQGPVSPDSLTVGSVGTDHVNLSWNVSSIMLMTPHSYNVTICNHACKTLLYPYTNGSSLMSIGISNLTAATKYFIQISAVVVRPNNVTGTKTILLDSPVTLQIRTAKSVSNNVMVILKLLKLVLLGPPLWILYRVLKKEDITEAVDDASLLELSSPDAADDQFPQRTRGFG